VAAVEEINSAARLAGKFFPVPKAGLLIGVRCIETAGSCLLNGASGQECFGLLWDEKLLDYNPLSELAGS
jgi:hypothetical protein